ncbi:ligand-binding protein SH3 [Spirochaetia bacterium]|nr:ligand-binding protein SH3 [Spirochaetia bacterium]
MKVIIVTALLALLPISELRGAIPYAVANGIQWYNAYLIAVTLNALVAPVCWIFLETVHRLFLSWKWYRNLSEKIIERARNKLRPAVEKWGWIGLGLFVAIPLPMTGAWTGTIGAWILGVDRKRTFLAILAGVIVSGAIVSAIVVLGVHIFFVPTYP